MKTVFTASELMTVAVKEIQRMCQLNSEPILKEYWCWTHDEKFSEFDLEKHKECQIEQEGIYL